MGGPEKTSGSSVVGQVYLLYLLPENHRQGIGRRLVEAVAEHLMCLGMRSLRIRVQTVNAPAGRLY